MSQHFDGPLAGFGPADVLMQPDGFADLLADGEHRIERRHRLLKDHRDPPAAHAAHFAFGQFREHLRRLAGRAVQRDPAAGEPAGSGDQPDDAHGGDAFARARFADQPQRLAAADRQRDVVDRLDHAFVGVEVGLQVFDRSSSGSVMARLGRSGMDGYIRSFGSMASRRPLPTRLNSVTVRKMPSEGTTISHQ